MSQAHDKGLEFHGSLPFEARPIAAMPDEHAMLVINQGNEQALRSVMMLQDKPDHDDSDPVFQELKRQDQKLNLVLDLLGTLLVQFKAIPATRELQLTDSELRFDHGDAGLQGLCEVLLYIEPGLPRPLRLFGTAQREEGSGTTSVVFQGLSRSLTDQLDKYLFRYHRRLVASAVSGRQTG